MPLHVRTSLEQLVDPPFGRPMRSSWTRETWMSGRNAHRQRVDPTCELEIVAGCHRSRRGHPPTADSPVARKPKSLCSGREVAKRRIAGWSALRRSSSRYRSVCFIRLRVVLPMVAVMCAVGIQGTDRMPDCSLPPALPVPNRIRRFGRSVDSGFLVLGHMVGLNPVHAMPFRIAGLRQRSMDGAVERFRSSLLVSRVRKPGQTQEAPDDANQCDDDEENQKIHDAALQ